MKIGFASWANFLPARCKPLQGKSLRDCPETKAYPELALICYFLLFVCLYPLLDVPSRSVANRRTAVNFDTMGKSRADD
jgi:hypothetical protein